MSDKIVVCKGDCHGETFDIEAIAKTMARKGVSMNDLIIVIAGDFGIPWPGYPEDNVEKLAKVNHIGCDVVAVLGNHEWWSLVYSMPDGSFMGADVHECVYDGVKYDNIHYVADPTVMTIDGKDYLLIPGADSHDIADGILYGLRPVGETETIRSWWDENKDEVNEFEGRFKQREHRWPQYRIEGMSWWREEAIQIDKLTSLLDEHGRSFHAVVSHDAPDRFAYEFQLHRSLWERHLPTDDERKLDKIYESLTFRHWVHGHFHADMVSHEDDRVTISYYIPHVLSDNFQLTADDKFDMISSESKSIGN